MNKEITVSNYDFQNVIRAVLILPSLSIIFFFILWKISGSFTISICISSAILLMAFIGIILSLKNVVIHGNELNETYLFSKAKSQVFHLSELYINIYHPPSATCHSEQAQIRIKKGGKRIIQFNRSFEYNNEIVIEYLVGLNVELKRNSPIYNLNR